MGGRSLTNIISHFASVRIVHIRLLLLFHLDMRRVTSLITFLPCSSLFTPRF